MYKYRLQRKNMNTPMKLANRFREVMLMELGLQILTLKMN